MINLAEAEKVIAGLEALCIMHIKQLDKLKTEFKEREAKLIQTAFEAGVQYESDDDIYGIGLAPSDYIYEKAAL